VNKALLALAGLTVIAVLADLWDALGRSVQPGPVDPRVHKALPARQALRVLMGKSELPEPPERPASTEPTGWTEPPVHLAHLVPKGAKVFRDQQGRMAFRGQPVSEDQWVRLVGRVYKVNQAPRAIRDPQAPRARQGDSPARLGSHRPSSRSTRREGK
jgi:hypothetical protein